jgi:hypothetical protein
MRGSESSFPTFGDDGREFQGMAHDAVGQNGCGAVSRWLASGHWSSGGITHGAAMKGANLGFRLLQEEIRGDTTIIYRASCSMISYAVGTLSPSRIRFEMTLIPLGFVGEKIFFGFTLFLTIVGDNTSSGHSWAMRGGRTRSGWAPLRRKEKKNSGPAKNSAR